MERAAGNLSAARSLLMRGRELTPSRVRLHTTIAQVSYTQPQPLPNP